jgi:carboxypeptidase family protein
VLIAPLGQARKVEQKSLDCFLKLKMGRNGMKRNVQRTVRGIVFVAMTLLVLSGARLQAQANSGLTGTITDQQGAVMVGVDVTLANSATGFSVSAKSNESGVYTFSDIPPAPTYALTFTRDGFKTLTVNRVILSVDNKETRDVTLELGDTKTTVEVTASAGETLNTTDASVGTVIQGDVVQDLPSLFVNNAALYLELAPGVVQPTNQQADGEGAVTGSRSDQTNVTLDGLDVNDQRNGQAFISSVNTPLDSIQELKTTVAGGDATFGTSAGGQLELVTKSGTNNFHGQAFDFNRVTALAANDYFNNLQGIPNPKLIRNQFGGDLGGPIVKNKAYFFFSYNGLRETSGSPENQVVPLAALRNGQLNYINVGKQLVTTPLTGANSLQMLDPTGIGADPALLSFFNSRPYPVSNNLAVGDGINTGGFFFSAPFHRKDNTFVGRLDYQISANHRLFARTTFDRSNDDDNVNSVIQIFPGDKAPAASIIDHSRSWVVGDTWVISADKTNQISFGQTTSVIGFQVNTAPTQTQFVNFFFNVNQITPPFISPGGQFPKVPVYQARDTFSWIRGKHAIQLGGVIKPVIFKSGNLTDFNTFSIGLGGNVTSLPATSFPSDFGGDSTEFGSLFALAIGRFASTASSFNYDVHGNALPQGQVAERDYHSTQYEFFAQDSWQVRSGLTVTYGLRWQFHNPLYEVNGFQAVPSLSAQQIFGIRMTDAAQGISGPNAVPFLSYGLGGSANNGPGYYRPSYTDFEPRLGIAFSPSYTSGFLGHLFGDRKSSLRAGFGINDDVNLIGQGFELDETSFLFSNTIPQNFGNLATDLRFTGLDSLPSTPGGGTTPRPSFTPNVDSTGFPIGFFNGGFGQGPFFNFDPNYKTPYEMTITAGFQRQLPGDWLVSGTYVGRLGRRLTALGDPAQTLNFKDAASGQFLYDAFGKVQSQIQANVPFTNVTNQPWFENQITAAINQSGIPNCATAGSLLTGGQFPGLSCTQLAAGFAGGAFEIGDVSTVIQTLADNHDLSGTLQQGLLLPNVGLLAQNGAAGFIGNFSASSYNAFVLQVNHRLSHNLSLQANYTYSHSIDNDSNVQNALISFSAAEVCDLRNLRVCRGSSDFDQRHNFVGSFEYALPVGHDQWLLHDSSKWLNEIVGGWKFSGIFTAFSGNPFKVDSGAFTIDFTQTQPGVFIGSKSDIKGGIHQVPAQQAGVAPTVQFFSNVDNAQNAFTFPIAGGPGNRNIATGPSFWNLDAALLKDFKMPYAETHVLQFRAEAFNLFNHVNFANPGASLINPGTFGAISQDRNGARQVQLALKYSF